MSEPLQEYLGRFNVTSDLDNLSVGGNAISLATGYTYIRGYTSESTNRLIEDLQTKIRAIGSSYSLSTVTYSTSTGKITIALIDSGSGATVADISWTDSDLQSLLGFTGSQTGASSYTATNQPRYVWRPSQGLADYPIELENWYSANSTSLSYTSESGACYALESETLYDGFYSYRLLPESEVKSDSSTVWESFEQFWKDTFTGIPQPVRCYWDRTQNASSDVFECFLSPVGDDAMVGKLTDYISRTMSNLDTLWNVNFSLRKYIEP